MAGSLGDRRYGRPPRLEGICAVVRRAVTFGIGMWGTRVQELLIQQKNHYALRLVMIH